MENEIPKFYVCQDGVVISVEGDVPLVLCLPYDVWDAMVDYANKARDPQKRTRLENKTLGSPPLDFDQLLKEIRDARDK